MKKYHVFATVDILNISAPTEQAAMSQAEETLKNILGTGYNINVEAAIHKEETLYKCDDCEYTAPLSDMNQRPHGGYGCRVCAGEVNEI